MQAMCDALKNTVRRSLNTALIETPDSGTEGGELIMNSKERVRCAIERR
jgi:hypothetical protein